MSVRPSGALQPLAFTLRFWNFAGWSNKEVTRTIFILGAVSPVFNPVAPKKLVKWTFSPLVNALQPLAFGLRFRYFPCWSIKEVTWTLLIWVMFRPFLTLPVLISLWRNVRSVLIIFTRKHPQTPIFASKQHPDVIDCQNISWTYGVYRGWKGTLFTNIEAKIVFKIHKMS